MSYVLDSDVVIAALDRADAHHPAAVSGLKRMAAEGHGLALSLVSYAEALVRPAEDPETLQAARAAIRAIGVELVAPTPAIAREAARLRATGVSLADAFVLATARVSGGSVATFDKRVRRAMKQVGIGLAPAMR